MLAVASTARWTKPVCDPGAVRMEAEEGEGEGAVVIAGEPVGGLESIWSSEAMGDNERAEMDQRERTCNKRRDGEFQTGMAGGGGGDWKDHAMPPHARQSVCKTSQ